MSRPNGPSASKVLQNAPQLTSAAPQTAAAPAAPQQVENHGSVLVATSNSSLATSQDSSQDSSILPKTQEPASDSNTTPSTRSLQRKEEILQALAAMLEQSPGQRITTAALAQKVGVSEPALYRHFPSKARMFEGLIEFIETTLLTKIDSIIQQHKAAETRLKLIVQLILGFAERNPGMCRILTSDALHGEQERLRERVQQLLDKLEQQLRWCLRERKLREGKGVRDEAALANAILAYCEGKIQQFVRSGFTIHPTEHMDAQWQFLRLALH